MAKKVRCPQCGAKNAADARRCRVCTTILNADIAAEQPASGLGGGALGAPAPPVSAADPGVPPPAGPSPAPDGQAPPGDGIVIDVPPRHGEAPAPRVDLGADAVAGDGIVIDVPPRNPAAPPPPLDLDDGEPFDPDGLIIDPPR